MRLVKIAMAVSMLAVTTAAAAQQTGIRVYAIQVLATDPEALAAFYEKTFGMSETSRPVNTATTKEIVINSGSTPDVARKAVTTPIALFTRPPNTPAGALAALILEVPSMEKAIEAALANGGTLVRPAATLGTVRFAFLKDPDGNQIELVENTK